MAPLPDWSRPLGPSDIVPARLRWRPLRVWLPPRLSARPCGTKVVPVPVSVPPDQVWDPLTVRSPPVNTPPVCLKFGSTRPPGTLFTNVAALSSVVPVLANVPLRVTAPPAFITTAPLLLSVEPAVNVNALPVLMSRELEAETVSGPAIVTV